MGDFGYVRNLSGGTQTPPTFTWVASGTIEEGDLCNFTTSANTLVKCTDDDATVAVLCTNGNTTGLSVEGIILTPEIVIRGALLSGVTHYNGDATGTIEMAAAVQTVGDTGNAVFRVIDTSISGYVDVVKLDSVGMTTA